MRPLLRHLRPAVIDSAWAASFKRQSQFHPRQIPQWFPERASTCLQCQFRAQFRRYTEGRPSPPTDRPKASEDYSPSGDSPIASPSPSTSTSTDNATAESSKSESTDPSEPSPFSNDNVSTSSLPSQEESRRSQIAKRFSYLMDELQANIFFAGQRLNDLTGYSGIEALKKDIERQEEHVRDTRALVREAKEAYTNAIAQRSASQREVNELLQRKHAWSGADLERFTSLYRSDHANEQAELRTQEALTSAERDADEAAAKLSKSILARYHEEQIWSDKIRRMSTWGTWGLMGVNVLLFLVFQIGVEPWRRKRLVKGFEEKVAEALERESAVSHVARGAAPAVVAANGTDTSTVILATPGDDVSKNEEKQNGENTDETATVTTEKDVAVDPVKTLPDVEALTENHEVLLTQETPEEEGDNASTMAVGSDAAMLSEPVTLLSDATTPATLVSTTSTEADPAKSPSHSSSPELLSTDDSASTQPQPPPASTKRWTPSVTLSTLSLASLSTIPASLSTTLTSLTTSLSLSLTAARLSLRDLFSDRQVALRKIDVTAVALEGVAAGAAFAGIVAVVVVRLGLGLQK
ncbi:MAG: hypothetical protein M1819_001434 [Sarea resinae]|nr:MAG: hypothetical protein M1819_001434 [Sarea resinae]